MIGKKTSSDDFDHWIVDYDNSLDILMVYINPLTTDLVEVIDSSLIEEENE